MKENQNVPARRFPGFDGAWERKKLGDIVSFIKGFAFKSEWYQTEGVRIVRVSDLGSSFIKLEKNSIFLSFEQLVGLEKYLIDKYDIIITTVGSKPDLVDSAVGRGILVENENEGLLNQNLIKLKSAGLNDNRFIFRHINSKKYITYIKGIQRGNANQSNITVADLLEYELFAPALPEQQKIATFFTTVDQKISQLKEKKNLLEQYKKGAMQALFAQQLRFRADDGSDFPDWEEKKLGEVAIKVSVKNKNGSVENVLTNSAIHGIVNQRDFFDKDIANPNNLEGYFLVEKDDFVYNPRVSVTAPVGPISRNHLHLGVMSPLYLVFRFIEGDLKYLEYLFNTNIWHEYLKDIANQGARADRMSFALKDFFLMPIPFPSLPEQQKIATFLSRLDERIALVAQQIAATEQWKKGLLQQMFC